MIFSIKVSICRKMTTGVDADDIYLVIFSFFLNLTFLRFRLENQKIDNFKFFIFAKFLSTREIFSKLPVLTDI